MLNFREYSYLVESAFASWEYTPPTSDPEKIMMDFYTFLNLDNESLITGKIEGAKLSDEDYEKKEIERRTKSEMREKLSENLTFVKNYNFDKLLEYLRTEFLNVLRFAVAAEFRHIFDDNGPEPLKSFFQKNFGEIGLKFITNYAMTYHARSKGWSRQASENEANRKKNETASYVTSYIAIKNGFKKTGMNWEQFMKIASKCFTGLQWSQAYGGTNWANISNAYSKLANAPDRPSKAIWIDHVYDLEHNTGSVFTKVKRYRKGGTCEWIKKALDFKANLETPKDFNKLVQKASMDLHAFVWAYIFSQYDVTKEDITGEKAKSVTSSKKYTNADYEKMSFDEIYSEYKNGDTDEDGNIFFVTAISKSWQNSFTQFNKKTGPARVYLLNKEMYKDWYKDNKLHRLDGPARVNPKEKLYYIDDIKYKEEEYWKKVKEISGETKGDSSVTPAKKYTNADYEKMSFDEIYSEYKNGDKDEDGNIFWATAITKSWRNSKNQYNKKNGPARVSKSVFDQEVYKDWYKDNKLHRLDGPARVNPKEKLYYIDDIQYSEKTYWKKVKDISGETAVASSVTPSKKYTNADYEKMSFDEIYSEYKNGDTDEDGNIFFVSSITKSWLNLEKQYNKKNGPARIYLSVTGTEVYKDWYKDNKLHRLDGPARVHPKEKLYYIDGIKYKEETYWKKVNEISGEPKGDSSVPPSKKYTNADYEKMSFEEIYSEYEIDNKDEDGNIFGAGSITKFWRNTSNQYNKMTGPARVCLFTNEVYKYWYKEHKLHRLDGPAVVSPKEKLYYIDGIQYNEEEYWKKVKEISGETAVASSVPPSKKYTNADYEKMSFEEIYSEYKNGDKDEDGSIFGASAISKSWYTAANGKNIFHKKNGPARVYLIDNEVHKDWYQDNKIHRLDGPARVHPNEKLYYIDGIEYDEEEYWKKVKEISGETKVASSVTPSKKSTSVTPSKKYTNAEYEKMSFDEIYSEYEIGDKDEDGNIFWSTAITKSWRNTSNQFNKKTGPATVYLLPSKDMSGQELYKVWYKDQKFHRLDGPARVHPNEKMYYIDGIQYAEETYWKKVKEISGETKGA